VKLLIYCFAINSPPFARLVLLEIFFFYQKYSFAEIEVFKYLYF